MSLKQKNMHIVNDRYGSHYDKISEIYEYLCDIEDAMQDEADQEAQIACNQPEAMNNEDEKTIADLLGPFAIIEDKNRPAIIKPIPVFGRMHPFFKPTEHIGIPRTSYYNPMNNLQIQDYTPEKIDYRL